MKKISNYINGDLVPPVNGEYLDNVEPATGRVYSRVPDSGEADVEKAAQAAGDAFEGWSRTPAEERSRVLLRIAGLIEARVDEFARLESVDSGKPVGLARSLDIPRSVANFRFFATAILHTRTDAHATDYAALNYTLRRPRGVAGLISPWNLPLYLLSWKIAPALATGNTAVAKPSELTPMTAFALSEVCREAGLPPGVLNVVHGLGARAGAAITGHDLVRTISFTGGTVTGGEIARVGAAGLKKVTLELGGKNPTVIFADADMDQAMDGALRSAFSNQGEICLCGSRILVERPAYAMFVERFVQEARRLSCGDPLEPGTRQGALISASHRDKVARYIALAREEGGTILCGGGPPASLPERCREGFFIEPTVIADLGPHCRVNQEEIFGPVVTILPFDREDQAVEWANSTAYGLAASVWTENLSRAHRVAEGIDCGTIWVNCWLFRDLRVPFGGMKQSGLGREGGEEALRFFTEPKNVCVAMK
ncbi:MAG: aldehyde dehydrogenase [Gemmatimonadales bacterium]